jgi:homeobox protein cut-like
MHSIFLVHLQGHSRRVREQDLQRQVTLARTQLKDLRVSNESNQAKLVDQTQRQGALLFRCYLGVSLSSILDQEVMSKFAEVDMIVADLERANSRVATVERRNVSNFACSLSK